MSSSLKSLVFALVGASVGFFAAACGQPQGAVHCTAANCGGCCDAKGICQAGTVDQACGVDAKVCAICSSGQHCSKAGVCGAGAGTGGGSGAGTGGGSGAGTGTGGGSSAGGGTGGALADCSAEAKLAYVVDSNGTLSSFNPKNLAAGTAFTDLGTLHCPAAAGGQPFSMSVDRNAVAWIIYDSGELFTVNVKQTPLTCTKTTFQPQNNIAEFGMGFAADAAGSNQETLFISGSPLGGPGATTQFGTLATTAPYTITTRGTLNGSPELTGTGDAKLWSFFPDTSPPKVAQLDKTNGSLLSSATFNASALAGTPMAWAFAFWGGDFFIFLQRTSDTSTNVWQMNGTTGSVTKVLDNTGRTIVGAGVSTCAPITFK